MKRVSCGWVENHLDGYAAGTLPETHQSAVAVHLAICPSCSQSYRIWSQLRNIIPQANAPAMSPFTERRALLGTKSPTHDAKKLRWIVAIPAIAAVVLMVLGFAGYRAMEELPATFKPVASIAKKSAVPEQISSITRSVTQALIEPESPQEQEHNQSIASVDEMGRRYIQVTPGTVLWLGDDAVIRAECISRRLARFHLTSGYVLADIGPNEPGFRFIVTTPGGAAEAWGTVFSVQVNATGKEQVRVVQGVVEVRGFAKDKPPQVLSLGQEIAKGNSKPTTSTERSMAKDLAFLHGIGISPAKTIQTCTSHNKPAITQAPAPVLSSLETNSPSALLALQANRIEDAAVIIEREAMENPHSKKTLDMLIRLAHAYRLQRNYAKASVIYDRIVASFPGSTAANNCLVTSGMMKLGAMSSAEQALSDFEKYLSRSPSGVLAQEAHIGRIRSLSSLGRDKQLLKMCSQYLQRYPYSRAASEVIRLRDLALAQLDNE